MPTIAEECSLCGQTFPYYSLLRCCRCRRLYCRNCTIYTEDRSVVCLNCARRIVSPKRLGTKYSPLTRYLAGRARFTDRTTLKFAEIEGIIGDDLPPSARQQVGWWSNAKSQAHAQAWLDVGWRAQDVDLSGRVVTFKRTVSAKAKTSRKRRASKTPLGKKTLSSLKPLKLRRKPSKSKIARAQARLKNVERVRSSTKRYRGEFGPQPTHEKRLYKPEAKPAAK